MKKISKIFVIAAVVVAGSGFAFGKEAKVNKNIRILLGSSEITVNLDDDYLKKRPIPVPEKNDAEIRKIPEKKNGKPVVNDTKRPVNKKDDKSHFRKPPRPKNPPRNEREQNRHEFSGRPKHEYSEQNVPRRAEKPDERPSAPWNERPIFWDMR